MKAVLMGLAAIAIMPLTASSPQLARFEVELGDWHVDNMHWTAPSRLTLDPNTGYATLYIEHAANMQRTGSFLDSGTLRCARINVEYFDDRQCLGEAFAAHTIEFFCLGYKKEIFQQTYVRGTGSEEWKALFHRANCVKPTKLWESPFG